MEADEARAGKLDEEHAKNGAGTAVWEAVALRGRSIVINAVQEGLEFA
jgi:hypothetical protein